MKSLGKSLSDMPFVRIVRGGLMMLVPVLMVGSLALILREFPIDLYQDFLRSFAGGLFYTFLSFIYNATFGMLSVYMVFFLSSSSAAQRCGGENMLGCIISGVASFLISVGFLSDSFVLTSFSAVGMFTAILCGTLAPLLFIHIDRHLKHSKVFFDGSEPMYNTAIAAIFPFAAVCCVFAGVNIAIDRVFNVGNFWQLFSNAVNALFSKVGLNFFGGLLYILLSSVLWFFGIHGSDVLESVTSHLFEPAMQVNMQAAASGQAPTEMFTKTFFDVFVLMGGCGSALSLLVAILLFSRRKSSRSLSKMAAFPMLFNINELMIFGLPIIYNPIMFIPFIAAPLACFLISSAAMSIGLVPLTTVAVEWTTPVILGGYRSTGAVSGAVLQIVNLAVGTLIYMPFVRRYDRSKELENKSNLDILVEKFKDNEAQNREIHLTGAGGTVGSVAKQLVNDLRADIAEGKLYMLYQPQNDINGCIGAEALLRWKHSSFGMIYPPLIIKLASEGGFLTELEKYIFNHVKSDMEKSGFLPRVSINVTVPTLQNEDFEAFLAENFPDAKIMNTRICVEITEQKELVTNSEMTETLSNLRKNGFLLAIDDFSMGFTSLKYLQECRFDEIKLDGSLVRNLTGSQNTKSAKDIISSIIYLSESLGFSVLAEFVETEEQRDALKNIGCREYQGYLMSKPITIEELKDYCGKSQKV